MSQTESDESFQLYDLRVEVVCPPGERIMCGAKEGDHFVLQGEMLTLPPGQGMSIYSIGELCGESTLHTYLDIRSHFEKRLSLTQE